MQYTVIEFFQSETEVSGGDTLNAFYNNCGR